MSARHCETAGHSWRADQRECVMCGAVDEDKRAAWLIRDTDAARWLEWAHELESESEGPPDLDLTPLSIGFDVRLHGIGVIVPRDTRSAAYDLGGQTRRATGTIDEIIAALTTAGYCCAVTGEGAR